jgi:hypothetical protein
VSVAFVAVVETAGLCSTMRFSSPNESVTNLDVIARFDLRAEIRARLPVDGDAAFCDQLVAMPARAKPRGSEEAIEAHGSGSVNRQNEKSLKTGSGPI